MRYSLLFLLKLLHELVLEYLRLINPILIEFMLDNLLVQDVVAELKLVHNINEVFLCDEIDACTCCHASYSHFAVRRIVNDLLQAKEFVLASNVEADNFLS